MVKEVKPMLDPKLIEIVRSALKGAKLTKFDASIVVIRESLAQGSWVPRGSVKAQSGFYQGIARSGYHRDYSREETRQAWDLDFCLQYGRAFEGKNVKRALALLRDGRTRDGEPVKLKLTDEQVFAWVELCRQKDEVFEFLHEARPAPKITRIGLSPKVTKTFTEMNLDLDVQSIRPAKLEKEERWIEGEDGKKQKVTIYRVVWSKGVVHGLSRFAGRGACEACGKPIPSCMFVPVEAHDRKSGKLVSLWLGCDCAANIFGIKDVGIDRNPPKN
jgi:hypothetical protein